MVSLASLPSPSSVFSAYASISASLMLFRTMFDQIIPHQLQNHIFSTLKCYFQPRSSMITLVIDERDGITTNELYDAAESYLCTKINPNIDCLKLSKNPKDLNVTINFARSENIIDFYEDIELQWRFVTEELHDNSKIPDERRYFELSVEKKHKEIVLSCYIPFILQKAKEIRDEKKVVKLHTLSNLHSYSSSVLWDSINLEHPSTFDTLAMEPSLKKAIIDDLDRFVKRKDFYKKVGKAWKRGYLLYGPPGTGKSSLIAAMANYLKFDIYDLELGNVNHDSDLKKLFLRTSNRSIIVIEDIDCSVKLPDRNGIPHSTGRLMDPQFTLSGLLNFIDGLWSSCGDERIIIFTTNNKETLDPALLRPGRMDMHIHMSYLTTHGFKLLASNYLNINFNNNDEDQDQYHHHHQWRRFREVEKLMNCVKVTPAEVAEELMKSDDVEISLEGVVNFLKRKKRENDEDVKDYNKLQKAKRVKSCDIKKKMNLVVNGDMNVMEENGKLVH